MEQMENVKVTSKIKIDYSILKKEGYKLDYGTKTPEYVDIYFVKKLDDLTNATILINEKRVVKRIEGSNYNDRCIEALSWKEIQGINQIIKQLT